MNDSKHELWDLYDRTGNSTNRNVRRGEPLGEGECLWTQHVVE